MINLERWRESGRYFDFKGHRIFYVDSADQPTAAEAHSPDDAPPQIIICLHGYPTSSWDWHLLWPGLAKRFRVIAVDWLGYGFSDKPVQEYSIGLQADIAESLLASLNINSTHVLAHDYGDTVAQELLARYEENGRDSGSHVQITSVCFLNGGLFPETHRALLTQRIMIGRFGGLFLAIVPDKTLKSRLCSLFGPDTQPSPQQLDSLWQAIRFNDGNKILHLLLHYIPERIKYRERWVGVLQNTDVPLRLIDGAQDVVSGLHMAQRYLELVPDPDVVLQDDIGHYPQLEASERTLNSYLEFLSAFSKS
ncbi:MAG: alpha/beta hydrolase [Gammaproteobacteria bacterium]|nr:alpha/beta hydrolase [Gammaproteobacteria bacterium]